LFLTQHVGAPSVPVVKLKDTVSEGALVADIPDGNLGSKIHASISGSVVETTDKHIVISNN
ncbi:MAG: electron transport complex protein RnfC, partial [Actinomycetota bacterium]|nr:electron transport complex protein RnfC [Actinomycetota bacterium]